MHKRCVFTKKEAKLTNFIQDDLQNLLKYNIVKLIKQMYNYLTSSGVGKLRPAKGKFVAHEHVFFLNGIRPAKENSTVLKSH